MSYRLTYFFYFFYLGLFFNLVSGRFEVLGFSGFQRALIFGLIPGLAFFFNMFWGRMADLFRSRTRFLAALSLVSSVCLAAVFSRESFGAYVLMALVTGVLVFPIIPLNDSLTISFAAREKIPYGRFRQWGTLSFIAANLTVAVLIRLFGDSGLNEKHLLYLMPASLCLIAFSASASRENAVEGATPSLDRFMKILGRPTLLLFLGAVFLHNISFVGMFSYLSPHLKTLGYGPGFIALCWALSPAVEVFVFRYSLWFRKRFPVPVLFTSAMLANGVRWCFMLASDNPAVMASAQLFHSIAFGGYYVAAIEILSRTIPESLRSSGQGVFGAVVCLGMIAGNSIAGVAFEWGGTRAVFGACLAASVAATVLAGTAEKRLKPFFEEDA